MQKTESNQSPAHIEVEHISDKCAIYHCNKNIHSVINGTDEKTNLYQYDHYTARGPYGPQTDASIEADPQAWESYIIGIDAHTQGDAVRATRDALLVASDKYMLTDMPTEGTKTVWKTYRQALRDVPEQPGFPYDVDWPKISN